MDSSVANYSGTSGVSPQIQGKTATPHIICSGKCKEISINAPENALIEKTFFLWNGKFLYPFKKSALKFVLIKKINLEQSLVQLVIESFILCAYIFNLAFN